MCVQFITSIDDYVTEKTSPVVTEVLKSKLKTTLCQEKIKGLYVKSKESMNI